MQEAPARHRFRPAVMKADAVAPDKREAWVTKQVAQGVEVLICHPRPVQTGPVKVVFMAYRKTAPGRRAQARGAEATARPDSVGTTRSRALTVNFERASDTIAEGQTLTVTVTLSAAPEAPVAASHCRAYGP